MDPNKVSLELTENQYRDLVKLVFLGNMVAEDVAEDDVMARFVDLQQLLFAFSGPRKGNTFIAYDKKEDEYFLADDLEDELLELLEEYDESRFWESLIMRLTLRDLKKKFTDKELQEMHEEKGSHEMQILHDYYISEFDDNDIDNLKVISMKKV